MGMILLQGVMVNVGDGGMSLGSEGGSGYRLIVVLSWPGRGHFDIP